MKDRKAVALRRPRVLAALLGFVMFLVFVGFIYFAPQAARDPSGGATGGSGKFLAELIEALPMNARVFVFVAFGVVGIVTTLPPTLRSAALMGALAAAVDDGRLTLWRPLSLKHGAKRGIDVGHGDVVVLAYFTRETGAYGYISRDPGEYGYRTGHFLRVAVRTQVLDVPLEAAPGKFTAAGLVTAAQAVGASVRFDGDAKSMGGAVSTGSSYNAW